jgi:hypothetical protein
MSRSGPKETPRDLAVTQPEVHTEAGRDANSVGIAPTADGEKR